MLNSVSVEKDRKNRYNNVDKRADTIDSTMLEVKSSKVLDQWYLNGDVFVPSKLVVDGYLMLPPGILLSWEHQIQ